ncbi:MAG TPA: hypothetical protein V6C81_10600 [Planktothrix sp.]|jgi:predicted DNA binding CopG/RHH family protein
MPKGEFDRNKIRRTGEYKLSAALSAKVTKKIAVAEKELAGVRVNFRWGSAQLTLVKTVAELIGVPYQTYIKQVLYRQCLEDLKAFKDAADSPNPPKKK